MSSRLRRWGPPLVAAVICGWLLSRMEPGRFLGAFHSADWRLVLAAAGLNLTLNSVARVMRFQALLSPLNRGANRLGAMELAAVVLGTRALNALLPARAGETFRGFQLLRKHGLPASGVIAAVIAEPVIEALALAVPAALLLAIPHPRNGLEGAIYAAVVIGALILAGGIALARRPHRGKTAGGLWATLNGVLDALREIRSPSQWGRALLWSWISDAIDLSTIALCLAAVGAPLSLAAWYLILLAVNLAIAVPISPANVGTLEAAAVFAACSFGIDRSSALVFAIAYHGVHLFTTLLAGTLGFSASRERAAC